MMRTKHTSHDGREYVLRLLDPERCGDGEYRCDMVVSVDGVVTARRSSLGVDAAQARRCAMQLLQVYIDSISS